MKTQYLNSPVGKTLFFKSLPVFIGIFANITYNLVDTFFIAKLGTEELAAMSFCFPVVMIVINIIMGMGTALSSIVSRHLGAGNEIEAKEATSQGVLFSIIISTFLSFLGIVTVNPLFRALGVDSGLLGFARDYILIWYFGMVFISLSALGGSLFRAKGNVLYPSLVLFLGAVLNAILDPILIFGWGPIKALGIKGAAWTTVFGNVISVIFIYSKLWREKDISFSKIFCAFKFKIHLAISRIALPTALASSLMPISTAYTNWLLIPYGSSAVAGNSIATRIETLPFIAVFALASILSPFIGQNWGAGQVDRIQSALKKSFLFSYIIGAFFAIILISFKNSIYLLFDQNQNVQFVTSLYFRFIPMTYGILGTVFLTTHSLNAVGKPFQGNLLSASRLIILYIPIATLLNLKMGIEGIFIARITANTAIGLLSTLFAYRIFFKNSEKIKTLG